ncbi:uncharacterized protein B0P05DRAFT_557990 [Gilbertella persicaria]|uniref:uncharacterized protein n=1 Tax=Gilbertella persicaria TaxID=101096 RepID=UPI00221F82A4|nr:uncharacterized protein B0P05DRAFT_557990 [Gilbertella persicaria]KAI8060400.1 hypothetical protein B0P05DRAFT_557990 [Gilbertella persicaria]
MYYFAGSSEICLCIVMWFCNSSFFLYFILFFMSKQNTYTKIDEIEASSILVSLANHTPTMSIHHLLDNHSTSHIPIPTVYTSPNQHQHPSRPYVMKQTPKIRRNALQAYISYMTYTDMRKKGTTTNKLIEQPLTAFLHRPFNDRFSSK